MVKLCQNREKIKKKILETAGNIVATLSKPSKWIILKTYFNKNKVTVFGVVNMVLWHFSDEGHIERK